MCAWFTQENHTYREKIRERLVCRFLLMEDWRNSAAQLPTSANWGTANEGLFVEVILWIVDDGVHRKHQIYSSFINSFVACCSWDANLTVSEHGVVIKASKSSSRNDASKRLWVTVHMNYLTLLLTKDKKNWPGRPHQGHLYCPLWYDEKGIKRCLQFLSSGDCVVKICLHLRLIKWVAKERTT